jgi:hypothetical protein
VTPVGPSRDTTDCALWINKYLGDCFRRLNCSIFGGGVDAWFKKNREILLKEKTFVSGDLESATDLFDGRITDDCIDSFSEILNLESNEISEIKSFTTRCFYLRSRGSNKVIDLQTRGQMMGSEISFPLLCIISLTAYIISETTEEFQSALINSERRRAFKMLQSLRKVGINGDDIVFSTSVPITWENGVSRVGGVVSSGKSLKNDFYFTVNSELWCRNGKVPHVVRPSFVSSINEGSKFFISPDREWTEYRFNPMIRDRSIFNIEERLKLDIPVAWGGLGLVKKYKPFRAALQYLVSQERRVASRKGIWKGSVFGLAESYLKNQKLKEFGPKTEVLASRDMKKAFARTYGTECALWKDPVELDQSVMKNLIYHARLMVDGTVSSETLYESWKKLMNVPRTHTIMKVPAGLARQYGKVLDEFDWRCKLPSELKTPLSFERASWEKISENLPFHDLKTDPVPPSPASENVSLSPVSDHYYFWEVPQRTFISTLCSRDFSLFEVDDQIQAAYTG